MRVQVQHLLGRGDRAGAESMLRRILTVAPGDTEALFSLGQIEFMRGSWAAATEHLRKADRLNPTVWQFKYLLGIALWELHEFASATQVLEKAVRLIPADVEPAKRLISRVLSRALATEDDPALWRDVLSFLLQRPDANEWMRFLTGCGYHRGAPHIHNTRIFVNLVIPLVRSALGSGSFRQALDLHVAGLVVAALSPHTQEQWAWCFDRLNPPFIDAGEALRKTLPTLPLPEAPTGAPPDQARGPVVAFVADYAVSVGSGLVMLMHILEQVAPAKNCPIVPVVYTVQGTSPELASKCRNLNIALVDFDAERMTPYARDDLAARLVAMRERSRADGVSVAAFFSTYEGFVCLASSVGLAPVQVYLTMGFHSLNTPRIDAYLACISLNRGATRILGRPWRTLPFPFPNPFPRDDSPEGAARLRQSGEIREKLLLRHEVILGTLARPEKLDDAFIDALTRILTDNPSAVFLWFGKESEASDAAICRRLRTSFERRGIGERCLFQGWVDTKVYARVLDIHLDCFTLPTGLTMAETFSAGMAYALKRGEDTNVGVGAILGSILDAPQDDHAAAEARGLFADAETGENLLMLADTAEQYISYVNRMMRDAAFRAMVGTAAARFMKTYFHESNHMGTVFSEIVADVIDEARHKTGGPAEHQPDSP